MKAGTESELVTGALDFLRLHGVMAWRSNNAGVFDPARKRFRAFRGLKGVADVIGVCGHPGDHHGLDGRILACELKRPGGRLSADQAAFLDAVRGRGGVALCVSSLGELEQALRAEGVIR